MAFILSLLVIFSSYGDIKFKTDRIETEYDELYNKNKDLHSIITILDINAIVLFDKNITITEIYRTQKEQNRYYKGKPDFRSPHQDWLAIDIRTKNFNKKQIKKLVKIVNEHSNSTNTYIPTAFYHNIGLGPHIHIQFKPRK